MKDSIKENFEEDYKLNLLFLAIKSLVKKNKEDIEEFLKNKEAKEFSKDKEDIKKFSKDKKDIKEFLKDFIEEDSKEDYKLYLLF